MNEFEKPVLEVIYFDEEDIITASTDPKNDDDVTGEL